MSRSAGVPTSFIIGGSPGPVKPRDIVTFAKHEILKHADELSERQISAVRAIVPGGQTHFQASLLNSLCEQLGIPISAKIESGATRLWRMRDTRKKLWRGRLESEVSNLDQVQASRPKAPPRKDNGQ